MTASIATDVHDLLGIARDRSQEGRRRLVTIVGDLFFARGVELTDQERALITDILRKLIREVAAPVRRILSEKLASADYAPREIVVQLANDEFQVAEAILLKSTALHDADLIEIVYHRTLEHQLAVALRRGLGEAVADALVDTGHEDVIRTLLQNQDARVSQATMAYLVDQSRTVDSFQEPILRRHDLGPELAKQMYLFVSAALRHHIVENFPIDASELDAMVEASAFQAIDELERERGKAPGPPQALAHRLQEAGQLTPHYLIQSLRQGEVALFEAMFAEMTGLRPTLVRRLLFEPDAESLAVACRAAEIDRPTFASIFLLTRRAHPKATAVRPQDLSRVLNWFDRVDPGAARAVVARWRCDPRLLNAMRLVEGGNHALATP